MHNIFYHVSLFPQASHPFLHNRMCINGFSSILYYLVQFEKIKCSNFQKFFAYFNRTLWLVVSLEKYSQTSTKHLFYIFWLDICFVDPRRQLFQQYLISISYEEVKSNWCILANNIVLFDWTYKGFYAYLN